MKRSLSVAAILAAGALLATAGSEARAQEAGCPSCGKCPPPFKWYAEKPPCIIFKHACPRPVCDPCHLEHYGYYQTCWRPWNFPPDWSHCPTPPPGVVLPAPPYPPYTPKSAYPRSIVPDLKDNRKDELPTPRVEPTASMAPAAATPRLVAIPTVLTPAPVTTAPPLATTPMTVTTPPMFRISTVR